ncbi:flagellar assembly protein FliX [Zavarzinia compransoris]|uniref:Flagellar assembly regulator FliX n=1 Tax=Zavarzinia compransoris TaxID=1264899 RepID=A0A317DZE5_9PROT|nr:flagellar assembly protein FliX [Zavarzinia compransoris]PWR19791.1 flagellar assembly regulator FliX [Zavarzinia compransoris]TDP45105.1 class II flagellar assembly regulator [Zavarzinia compransoris]
MKIDGSGRIGGPGPTGARRGARSGDGSFSLGGTGEAEAAAAPAGVGPLGGISALFALQEVDADGERKRAARRGNDLLDRLEELRLGLLLGHVSRDRLEDMLALVRSRQEQFTDPRLAAVLADIELRAEVELAKLGY